MKRILLIGAGHAHLAVLRAFKAAPLNGARLALVAPHDKQLYPGMLPGVIAGHYRRYEAELDVARLAEAACAEFIGGTVAQLDPQRRIATLQDGTEIEYDLASLNVGSLPAASFPGAELALAARPVELFFEKLSAARLNRVAIAGAGATGAELAMALRHRGAAVTLYSEGAPRLAPRIETMLRSMGVDLRPGMAVNAIEPGPLVVAGPSRQAFDLVILASGAVPPPWLRGGGLECDERGFAVVNDRLQSVSHPEVFAAGGCATRAQALRQGKILARTFRRLVQDQSARRYRPQRNALQLLSCGRRYAIAQRGGWSAEGRWVWWWKNAVDRRWIKSLKV